MKVSIITVCLNSEKHIEQTIKSVLNQTYKDIEYIIVDGKSNDNTLNIIEKYKPLFKGRLKVISEKDNGIYDAMNKGIGYSTGELIGIINSDDWYEKDAVENAVKHYKGNNVIYGAMLIWKENSIIKMQIRPHTELEKAMIGHPAVFVPKKIYIKNGVFSTKYKLASDYELMLRLYQLKIEFTYVPKILANFRDGGASAKNEKITDNETALIKKEYGYDKCNYTIDADNNIQSKFYWNRLIRNINNNPYNNIYIYGRGNHTKLLIEYIKDKINKQIKGIIDRKIENKQEKFLGIYDQYEIEEIKDKADAIIISSISYEYDIYNRIKNLNNKVDIIRIYGVDSIEEANKIISDFSI